MEHRGNFFLPHQIMRSDQLNSSIGSVIAKNLQGVSKLLAQQEAALFYRTEDTAKALGDVGDISATCANKSGDTSAIIWTISGTDSSGRVHRFLPGMLIDIYNSTTKVNTDYKLAIDDVDPINDQVTIRRIDGGTFQVTDIDDDYLVVIAGSYGVAPHSMASWIKNSGTLFNIDLSKHSAFKSYIPSAESAALTENLLNTRYYKMGEAYPGHWCETAITTNGVLVGLINNLDNASAVTDQAVTGRMRYDRNDEALMVEAGWEGFKYRFAGRPVTVYPSTYCEPGYWYGLKLADRNLRRYVPPGIPGAKTDGRIGNEVEFVAPIGGSGSIFKHAHLAGSGGTSDFVEAPFVRQWQILPEDPRSIMLSGITEVSV